MPVTRYAQKEQGRKIGNGCKESRASCAALAKMKSYGAFLTGAKKATDKLEKRCARGGVSLRLAA
jgi:hypothetical protein